MMLRLAVGLARLKPVRVALIRLGPASQCDVDHAQRASGRWPERLGQAPLDQATAVEAHRAGRLPRNRHPFRRWRSGPLRLVADRATWTGTAIAIARAWSRMTGTLTTSTIPHNPQPHDQHPQLRRSPVGPGRCLALPDSGTYRLQDTVYQVTRHSLDNGRTPRIAGLVWTVPITTRQHDTLRRNYAKRSLRRPIGPSSHIQVRVEEARCPASNCFGARRGWCVLVLAYDGLVMEVL